MEIYLGAQQEEVVVSVFSSDGRYISSTTTLPLDGIVKLDLSSLATGIYYLKYEGRTIKGTSKVIKE